MSETNASHEEKATGRVAVIRAVNTPLGFFVLVVLVVEAALTTLATQTNPQYLVTIMGFMAAVVLALIGAVVLLVFKRPWELSSSDKRSLIQEDHFYRTIDGGWWEYMSPSDGTALSYVEISFNARTGGVLMHGSSYSLEGDHVANWQGVTYSVRDAKILYTWEGRSVAPMEHYVGLGDISFDRTRTNAAGFYVDVNVPRLRAISKSVRMVRATKEERQIHGCGDPALIADLVSKKLRMAMRPEPEFRLRTGTGQ